MGLIAKIEPLSTTRALRGPFDYRLPEALAGVEVGALLAIPFSGRRMLGVVVARAEHSELPAERLAEPLHALGPSVPPELVALAGWLAQAYCSTPARALSLVLPPGVGTGSQPRVRARRALVAEITATGSEALSTGRERLTGAQRNVLEGLARAGARPATTAGADHAALRRLERRGLISLAPRAWRRRPSTGPGRGRPAGEPDLTAEQEAALAPLTGAIAAGRAERLLLHGVTGSGKTEVYLQAVRAALVAGRGAIMLVPEIALTPQTVGRVTERFGETVAILHSGLSDGERYDEWMRLRRGEARICVGARSAVFAPVPRLGLVVVDEEHDGSYKQESDPRYDARTVAEHRARSARAVLVCGTATPRPESVRRLRRLRLTRRVDGRALPAVSVLDMRGRPGPLHPDTVAALAEVRRTRGKAVVLLNRRGWSNFLDCRACGHAWSCPHCDVSLVLHRAAGQVACHHCGHLETIPARCVTCGSPAVARHGAGTERLEHELGEALGDPGFPILRLDADVVGRGRGAAGEVLERFDRAGSGVLLGTQMVAKGHDFPAVTLGVVLDADATLRFPDFRSEERTFALVAQLAGRAGRGPAGGRVLVQTLAPGARAIQHAARHDADAFLAEELDRRAALHYPPFGELIRVVCAAPASGAAHAAAAKLRAGIDPAAGTLLGPAPLFRLRGRERSQLMLKSSSREPAARAIRAAVDRLVDDRMHAGVSVSVDVDPQ